MIARRDDPRPLPALPQRPSGVPARRGGALRRASSSGSRTPTRRGSRKSRAIRCATCPSRIPYTYAERLLMVAAVAADEGDPRARDPVPGERAGALAGVRAGGRHAVPAPLLGLGRRRSSSGMRDGRLRGRRARRGHREGDLGRGRARRDARRRRSGTSLVPPGVARVIRSLDRARRSECSRSSSSCSTGSPTARTSRSADGAAVEAADDAEPRPAVRVGIVRRALCGRARACAVERGRALVDARLSARRVSRPRRIRGAGPRAGGRARSTFSPTRRCARPSGATTAGGSRDGPIRSETRRRPRRLVARCDGIEIDGLTFSLAARLARRGRAAHRRRRRRAGHRHRRVLSRPASGAASAAARARGRAHGARRRGVEPRGDAPARRRAVQRDHAQVVGPAARTCRRSRSATASTAPSSASRRSCAAWRVRSASRPRGGRDGRRGGRPARAARDRRTSGSTRATRSSSSTSRARTRRGTRRIRTRSAR